MHVIDRGPQQWFLLEHEGRLYLEVRCNHSFVEYNVHVALDEAETLAYRREGSGYIDRLASDIHDSAPAVIGSRSPYKGRNLVVAHGWETEAIGRAILAWVVENGPNI